MREPENPYISRPHMGMKPIERKLNFFAKQVYKGAFDSQVVRLDVIAPRVVGLDVRVASGQLDVFSEVLRLCGQVNVNSC